MKKILGRILSVIAVLCIIIITIIILFSATAYGYKSIFGNDLNLFGYELHCYYGREGPNCSIRLTPEAKAAQEAKEKAESETRQRNLERNYKCKSDNDCAVTKGGACVIKNSRLANDLGVVEQKEVQNKCRCLNSQVMSGCISAKDYESFISTPPQDSQTE
ncbi:MAG: hypothetical protein ABL857_07465 [Rickettsiales bacterium]